MSEMVLDRQVEASTLAAALTDAVNALARDVQVGEMDADRAVLLATCAFEKVACLDEEMGADGGLLRVMKDRLVPSARAVYASAVGRDAEGPGPIHWICAAAFERYLGD